MGQKSVFLNRNTFLILPVSVLLRLLNALELLYLLVLGDEVLLKVRDPPLQGRELARTSLWWGTGVKTNKKRKVM